MGRLTALALAWLAVVALGACSEQRTSDANAHPSGWVTAHPEAARSDLQSCTHCHGTDFRGGAGRAPNCYSCHLDGPPFAVHSASWGEPVAAHQTFEDSFSWTQCASPACHGSDLRAAPGSGATGPSCFDGACHVAGPRAPHAIPYGDPADHGHEARARQVYCRNCHGTPANGFSGGFVADAAILAKPRGNCSSASCHRAAKAHPTNWQGTDGTNPSYAATHRGITSEIVHRACSLCHDVTGTGSSPMGGAPSCFTSSFTNADGAASGCHAQGPGRRPHALPYAAATLHGATARADLAFCQQCHGIVGTPSFDGGIVTVACSSCHPQAGAHPTRWQGTNHADPPYPSSHRGISPADAAVTCNICHAVTSSGSSPVPAAPNCFRASFVNGAGDASACHVTGPGGIPFHPADWLNSHVFTARVSVASCLAECHRDETGTTQGIPGCASCHLGGATTDSRIMHPDGSPITSFDFGRLAGGAVGPHQAYVRDALGGDARSCGLEYCHGTDLRGGIAPSNRSWGDGWSCFLAACHGDTSKKWVLP